MSPEEAIKVLQQVRQWTDYPKEAFTIAIKALEQSLLPSNLDEAARDYCNSQPGWENNSDWAEEKDKEECRRDFKAGAQWLANQGETEEFEVSQDEDEECPSIYLNWLGQDGLCPLDPNKYKDGDIVELQLRKKL